MARLNGLEPDDTKKLQSAVDEKTDAKICEYPTPLARQTLASERENHKSGTDDHGKDPHEDFSVHAFRSNEN